MANSKCPNPNCTSLKENKTIFELREANFKSPFTYYFVQCSTCGTVIGVVDQKNTESLINNALLPTKNPFIDDDSNYEKMMAELISQSNAIIAIMKKLGIEV